MEYIWHMDSCSKSSLKIVIKPNDNVLSIKLSPELADIVTAKLKAGILQENEYHAYFVISCKANKQISTLMIIMPIRLTVA